MSQTTQLPIGIFDSGMGGLTVLRELKQALPQETFIYLGDTARLPYGTKSQETVKRYALQMASLLIELNIKLLVVACNTATTAALPYLKNQFPQLPIVGVVEPSATAAISATRNKKIALLATETTIQSGIYQKLLLSADPTIEIISQSCGLFVALAEEGCVDDEVATVAVQKYLKPITQQRHPCDTVILGCTHFPALIKPIAAVLHPQANLINSAKATAHVVQAILHDTKTTHPNEASPTTFLVTDLPERFIRIGKIFLGEAIVASQVFLVDGYNPTHIKPKPENKMPTTEQDFPPL